MRPLRLLFLGIGGLLLAGCVTDQSEQSFGRVQDTLQQRGGYDVAWTPKQDTPVTDQLVARFIGDDTLDPDEAVRLALLNNAELQADLDELGIAQADLIRASLLPNPVLDVGVRFVEGGGGEILELGIAQNLIDMLMIPRRKQRAKESIALAEGMAAAAVLDLAAETRTTYRMYQAQLARVELYQSVVDATFLASDMAKRLREAGNVIELDVLQEDTLYHEARLMLAEAQGKSMRQRDALNALLGLWGEQGIGWYVSPRLPEPEAMSIDPAKLVPEVINASLDLEAQRREINLLAQKLGIEEFEAVLPDLEAGAAAERESDGEWSVGPAVGVALPIFDHGQGIRAEYDAKLRQAMNRYHAMAVKLRASTRSAYVTAETTANTSRYMREVMLPLLNQVTQQTQLQFNAMQLGVFRMLEAKRAEIDAAERYLSALENHWAARIQLETLRMGRMPQTRFGIDTGGSLGGGASSLNNEKGGH